jgi:c-di-AMP phosphodiesterase-like protein
LNKKLTRIMEPSMALYFVVMLLFAAASLVWQWDVVWLAVGEAALTILLFVIYRASSIRRKNEILKYIESTVSADTAANDTANMPLPMMIVSMRSGEIIWGNNLFIQITGSGDELFSKKLQDVFPQFSITWLIEGKPESPDELVFNNRRYRVLGNLVRSDDDGKPLMLASIYLVDITDLLNARDEYVRSRPIVSIVLIDNYDELTNNLTDNNVSTLNAAIDVRINEWAEGHNGLLRKVERNRYIFIFESRYLQEFIDAKFSLLESIRSVVNPSGIAATISLGIGRDGASFQENYEFAALAIETALARGGDQAVIKNRYNFTFYGGRSRETERRTKVKSRVMANSLSELIAQSSHIFVMGHKNADLDAVGAAVGIACICRKRGKQAHIVVDMQKNAATALIKRVKATPEYADCFMTAQDAMLLADSRSLLVVVDTNRPDQVESIELLESLSRTAIIDHHRRAADFIEQVVLNLHEPYASSASELVTELLQYSVETQDILPIDAEALLAGIVLDTKNFSVRTGGRTFEAAAFLRRAGADTVSVKMLFQNDLDSTLARYQILQAAKHYRGEIAIAALDYTCNRTVAAQAADELLNIAGILTSFVLYPDGSRVIISARSIGDANVQVILEPLGGGGNAATAGAQVPDVTVREALGRLVQSIDQFYEE